jgi:glycosyltransferase involved in cell wall biosynthesis
VDNLTILIPFFNGEKQIGKLLDCIPLSTAPILIVDDLSDEPYQLNREGIKVIRLKKKGYFTGAVNYGLSKTDTDVLVLNQDVTFRNDKWIDFLEGYRASYAMIGERIKGDHPVWSSGYIQGTFMFIRRDAVQKVGLMNDEDYPLWGSTCEYQLRLARAGLSILIMEKIPGFVHEREGKHGEAIETILKREPSKRSKFIKTPPEISVIIPCYNYGRYLPSAVNSLVGGMTDLGEVPQQSFASFEVVIVDDGSTDNSAKFISKLVDPLKGVRAIKRENTEGTAAAINAGVKASYGKYITILGADDMRKTDALEVMYRNLIKHPHGFVYDSVLAFGYGRLKPEMHFGVSEYNFDRLLYKNHIHAGIMFPRKAWEEIGGYPEVMGDGREDWAVNIALGIKGYCGHLIEGYSGYLYRREGHNRSTRNGNQRDVFLGKLKMLFPEIYAGERPEMCCGSKRRGSTAKATNKSTKKGVILMSNANSILLEYIGANYGKASFYGIKTGNQYRAGKSHKIISVDKNDLHGSGNRPGLLDLKEYNKPIFRVYELPRKAVVKAPAKKVAPKKLATAKIEVTPFVETPQVEPVPSVKKPATRRTTAKK